MNLVPIRLIPVEVFGAEDGYGLMDAVSAWSDCNRAIGHIYRVDDLSETLRQPGDSITVWVEKDQVGWFLRQWGDESDKKGSIE